MYIQKNNIKNRGITLIALVLTMIIISVLAAVVLTVATSDNGLIQKAKQSREMQAISQEKATIMTAYSGVVVAKKGKFDKAKFIQELEKQKVELDKQEPDKKIKVLNDNPIKIEVTTKLATYLIEHGKIAMQHLNSGETQPPIIPTELQVGDTIIYDPTKGVTDQNLLTYTSEVSKNGYGEQKIIAKPENKEWVVISTSGGQVKMMSKEPIDGIEGGIDNAGNTQGFTLKGGKGYLYAEEELHRMCSVFGHGKGAGKISTKYTVGNPYIGEAEERTLSGSGARSLILSDIVSVIKGEGQDFTDEEKKIFEPNYKTSVTLEVYYPTKVSTKENGSSNDKKSFTYDSYYISKDKYTNYAKSEIKTARDALENSIFKDKNYWYGSRCVNMVWGSSNFCVGGVHSGGVGAGCLFWRRYQFGQCVFLGVWPKTCGILRWKYARKSKCRTMEDKRLK